MSSYETICKFYYHEDPADTLLDLLFQVGALKTDSTKEKQSELSTLVIKAISTNWKKVYSALSTGPHEFSHYAFDSASSRAELQKQLPKLFKGYKIQMDSSYPLYAYLIVANVYVEPTKLP